MKVKDLIKKLIDYNMEAEVKVIAHFKKYDYSITFSGSEGVEKRDVKEVSFYVDDLCGKENTQKNETEKKRILCPVCEERGLGACPYQDDMSAPCLYFK